MKRSAVYSCSLVWDGSTSRGLETTEHWWKPCRSKLYQNVKAGFQTHSSSCGFEHLSRMKHFHLFTPAVFSLTSHVGHLDLTFDLWPLFVCVFSGQAVVAERVRDLQSERDEARERAAVHRSREKRKQHGHGALAHHRLPREGADTCWTH